MVRLDAYVVYENMTVIIIALQLYRVPLWSSEKKNRRNTLYLYSGKRFGAKKNTNLFDGEIKRSIMINKIIIDRKHA